MLMTSKFGVDVVEEGCINVDVDDARSDAVVSALRMKICC